MLNGKLFRLAQPTLALEVVEGKQKAVTIPAKATVRVLADPTRNSDNETVPVEWEDRTVAMFVMDLKARGIETVEHAGA